MDLSDVISIEIGDSQVLSIEVGTDVIWEPKK